MRMIIFRPGVRPFSTFSMRTDAFLGVSQMTVVISAENRNKVRGHPPVCYVSDCLARRKRFFRASGFLKEIMSAHQIYNAQTMKYSIDNN